MKPVNFDYARPASVAEAIRLMSERAEARFVAGGQTLGPLLNLRLARPSLLIDISRIPELARIARSGDGIEIGAAVTHAAIEDVRVSDASPGPGPDASQEFLARVASGIAYRAVRNRGTVGGSLAHADPAADWLSALTALGAELSIAGRSGRRWVPLAGFVTAAMTTELGNGEMITAVRVPALSAGARWGFHKICRKTGDFADAIGAVVLDPERGLRRAVAGAVGRAPIVIGDPPGTNEPSRWTELLQTAGYDGDAYEMQIHAAALTRAWAEAHRS